MVQRQWKPIRQLLKTLSTGLPSDPAIPDRPKYNYTVEERED